MSDPIKVPLHITNDEAGVLGNLHITDAIAEQIVAATKLPGKFAAHEANTLQRLASLEQHVNTLVLSAEADGVHAIEQIRAKLAQLEKDHADAAGELRVNVRDCAPGTLAGKLLSANVILRHANGDLLSRAADAEQERDELRAKLAEACKADNPAMQTLEKQRDDAQNDAAVLQGSLKASSAREHALGITLKRYEESLAAMRQRAEKAEKEWTATGAAFVEKSEAWRSARAEADALRDELSKLKARKVVSVNVIESVVSDLFTNGSGAVAARLRLENGKLDLGGWSQVAMRQRMANTIRAAGVEVES